MNSFICKIGLTAIVAAMFLGCAKNKGDEIPPENTFKRTVKVSLTKDVDTKTALIEGEDKASYVWTEGDQAYLHIYENGVKGQITDAEYTDDMKKATFTVTFNTASSATEFQYVAKYTTEVSNNNNPLLPAIQNPLPNTYDPAADVLVSDVLSQSTAATSLQFKMHHVATINKMTLKGLKPGEKISRVELELDKIVAGYYSESNESFSSSDKKLTLLFEEKVVPSDGTFPVYFVCAPVSDASIQSVVVVSDQNVYTKPATAFSKTISFQKGKVTRFGMNMLGYDTPISTEITYTLITSMEDLTEGSYIIAAPGSTPKAMGHLSGNLHTAENVTKEDNTIKIDNSSSVLPLILAKDSNDNWTIKNDDENDSNYGKYIAWASGNYSTEQVGSYAWTISIEGDGIATIRSVDTPARYFQYNASNPRFVCYEISSKQQNVALYKSGVNPVGIEFEQKSFELIIGTEDYLTFEGQSVTKASTDTRSVSYAMTGNTIGTINSSTGAIALNGSTGTATVTATVVADATHSAGSVSYTITVTDPAINYDLLNNAFIGVEYSADQQTYISKSGLEGTSGRGSVYSSLSAGGTESTGPTIQIRTKNNNSGIVTTASGGNVTKIELSWNNGTVNGRSVQIYGKNTAYSSPSDLYNSSTQGTLIGELVKGSTTLTITGNYKYIGIKSKSEAIYLDEIRVYWRDDAGTYPVINVTSGNPVYVAKAGGSQSISYNITNPVSGQSVSATTNASSWISNINVGASTITFTVAAQTSGSPARAGNIILTYPGASNVQVSVSQEAGEGGSQASNGWLELPAMQTGNDLYNGVFKVGSARNYSYMYQYSTYTSMWTAYPLYASTMSSSEAIPGPYTPMQMASEEDRGQTWAANPNIEKSLQVNVWSGSYNVNLVNPPYVSDYYARGHQIPNADRSNNGNMQTQTYYATNSTPQIQNRFNGYIWGNLEDAVRDCVKDTVYVATGPVFRTVGGSESITIIHPSHDSGKDVPVPNYYWKVLLKVKRTNGVVTSASAVGFWFEHKQYNSQDYTPYVKSVNQIEALTGLDFFVNLPDNLEETAEANTNWTTFKNF